MGLSCGNAKCGSPPTSQRLQPLVADSATTHFCILFCILHMSKMIRVEEDTHAALAALKGDDETFDDLLFRLVAER